MTRDNAHHTRRTVLGVLTGGVVAGGLLGTVSGEEIPDTASITFDDQTVSRGRNQTVVVAEIRLPHPGGFVDIHDPHDTAEMPLGQVKGAYDEYLEPGVHRDVEVPLFEDVTCYEFERDRLEESTELMAMPHRDEPHDEEYTHLCTHGEEETEDGGFGDFPDVVRDTALVEVPPDGRDDPSSDGTKNRSLDR